MALPDDWASRPKWDKLRTWLVERFNHMEALHNKTFFSADAADLGILRSVYQTMNDLDIQEKSEVGENPVRPRRKR